MRLFDTHVHMDDPRYDPDRDALLLGLAAQGVELIRSQIEFINHFAASFGVS